LSFAEIIELIAIHRVELDASLDELKALETWLRSWQHDRLFSEQNLRWVRQEIAKAEAVSGINTEQAS
jgi:hypothetical protein